MCAWRRLALALSARSIWTWTTQFYQPSFSTPLNALSHIISHQPNQVSNERGAQEDLLIKTKTRDGKKKCLQQPSNSLSLSFLNVPSKMRSSLLLLTKYKSKTTYYAREDCLYGIQNLHSIRSVCSMANYPLMWTQNALWFTNLTKTVAVIWIVVFSLCCIHKNNNNNTIWISLPRALSRS